MTDHQPPVLVELFKLLPAPGQPFDPFDRKRWLDALAAVLEVAYPRHGAEPVIEAPRLGHHGVKVRCEECGELIGAQGMPGHRAMHGRDRAARESEARRRAASPAEPAAQVPTSADGGNVPATEAPLVACPGCGRLFRNQHALQVHQARSRCNQPAKLTVARAPEPEPAPEPAADVETPPPSHSCADCPQTFGSVLELDSHRRRFHGVRMAPLDSRPTIDTDAARRRAAEAI